MRPGQTLKHTLLREGALIEVSSTLIEGGATGLKTSLP